ncbi:MAG: hypothetical protein MHM6MM_006151 [Cercozoa sp. M6MM]
MSLSAHAPRAASQGRPGGASGAARLLDASRAADGAARAARTPRAAQRPLVV